MQETKGESRCLKQLAEMSVSTAQNFKMNSSIVNISLIGETGMKNVPSQTNLGCVLYISQSIISVRHSLHLVNANPNYNLIQIFFQMSGKVIHFASV